MALFCCMPDYESGVKNTKLRLRERGGGELLSDRHTTFNIIMKIKRIRSKFFTRRLMGSPNTNIASCESREIHFSFNAAVGQRIEGKRRYKVLTYIFAFTSFEYNTGQSV